MSVLLRRKRMTTAYILDAVRTPRGRGKPGKGALTGIHPQELLAQTLNQLAERTGIDKHDVEDVVAGCVTQVHEQGGRYCPQRCAGGRLADRSYWCGAQSLLRL